MEECAEPRIEVSLFLGHGWILKLDRVHCWELPSSRASWMQLPTYLESSGSSNRIRWIFTHVVFLVWVLEIGLFCLPISYWSDLIWIVQTWSKTVWSLIASHLDQFSLDYGCLPACWTMPNRQAIETRILWNYCSICIIFNQPSKSPGTSVRVGTIAGY